MLLNCGVREDSWTAGRSNQSILKEISPGCSLEGLMLKLKLQYFGHLMWRADSFENTLNAGKYWRRKEKGMTEDEMAWPTQWTWVWVNFESWWWTGRPGVLQSTGSQRVGHDWVTKLTNCLLSISLLSWKISSQFQDAESESVIHSVVSSSWQLLPGSSVHMGLVKGLHGYHYQLGCVFTHILHP